MQFLWYFKFPYVNRFQTFLQMLEHGWSTYSTYFIFVMFETH